MRVPAPDCEILAIVITPVGEGPWPGMLLYTDIFQLHRVDSADRAAAGLGRVRRLRAGDLPAW